MKNWKLIHFAFYTKVLFGLPWLLIHGRRVKKTIPKLAPARNPTGSVSGDGKSSLRMLFLGESTIAGLGVDTHVTGLPGAFAQRLSKLLKVNIEWEVIGKSGYRADEITTKLIPKIALQSYDLIVIGTGANDTFQLTPPASWRQSVDQLIKRLRHQFSTAPIFFLNLPPVRDFAAFTPLMQRLMGDLMDFYRLELMDLVAPLEDVFFYDRPITFEDWEARLGVTGDINDFFSDGVHPSELTYQTWGKDAAEHYFTLMTTR